MIRTRLRRTAPVLALVAASVGCGAGGPTAPALAFDNAVAQASCAPADGPATAIILPSADPSTPGAPQSSVTIHIWRALEELEGTWSFAAATDPQAVAVLRIASATDSDAAEGGWIAVRDVRTDQSIVAEVSIEFESGRRVRGRFVARWRRPPPGLICG